MIKRQIRHLAHIVDDLLDIARINQGRINLVKSPNDLVRIVIQTVEACRQELNLVLPQEPMWVDADADRLTQVIGNLVDNAIKFTPEGGRIDVCLTDEMEGALLNIRDTGIGMDSTMVSNAFELFTQAEHSLDRSKGGLGIGLALVKRLVELHGGRVEASSAGTNQGSEFTVWLPVLSHMPDLHKAQPISSEALPTSLRILIVEDNVDAASSLSTLLGLKGHQVRTAANGPSALLMINDFLPEVAFLDIGLPEMNGYELARSLRLDPRLSKLKLVALSGYAAEEDKQRCLQAGFDKHLAKPALIGEIEALLAKPDAID